MISREYANDSPSKWTRFTLFKEIRYRAAKEAAWSLALINKLHSEDFGLVHIPQFEVEQIDDVTLRLTTEYIKGRYVNPEELIIIKQYVVDRINDPDNEYSFSDFNANNWISEKETRRIYNVDLDNYKKITIDERLDLFNKKYSKFERYQRWYDMN